MLFIGLVKHLYLTPRVPELSSMTTFIRKADDFDLSQVKSCALAAYDIYVRRIGQEPAPMVADFAAAIDRDEVYVAEDNGRICGFTVFYPRDDHFHLENVAVRPELQRRGIGLLLITYVEQRAKHAGYDSIELYTNANMTENIGIYPKLGYEQYERRIEDGFDRVFFRKKL